MDQEIADKYIRGNFEPDDRLAVVVLNKHTGSVIQRIATAERIAAAEFQAWLRQQNAERCEVYISMNALRESARGRTKEDVRVIRHVYLDFDENGTAAVETLLKRDDLPKPNYLVNSSPGKWQVVWRVEGFTKERAEELQKGLARDTGADPAATDCARVLRLPGFYNHKYADRHFIRDECLTTEVYPQDRFPTFPADDRPSRPTGGVAKVQNGKDRAPGLSQSERDWAFAKRALARGEPKEVVIAVIANHRRYDKHDPQYYAEMTVRKAVEALSVGRMVGRTSPER